MHADRSAQQPRTCRDNGGCNQGGAVMIRQSSFDAVQSLDLIPQAIIGRPVSYFASSMHADFVSGHDGFDQFEGAVFVLDEKFSFALKRYRGHPNGTTTIYLP